MKIEHRTSTAYHHETLGSIERSHREFNRYVRQYLENNLSDWDHYLDYFQFCYNIEKHDSFAKKFFPYELVFNKNPNLPSDLCNGKVQPLYNVDNFVQEARFRLQKAHIAASELLNKMKQKNKVQYDKKSNPLELELNETVYLKTEPYNKLKSLSIPFKVVRLEHPNVLISNGTGSLLVHKNRLFK